MIYDDWVDFTLFFQSFKCSQPLCPFLHFNRSICETLSFEIFSLILIFCPVFSSSIFFYQDKSNWKTTIFTFYVLVFLCLSPACFLFAFLSLPLSSMVFPSTCSFSHAIMRPLSHVAGSSIFMTFETGGSDCKQIGRETFDLWPIRKQVLKKI